MTLEALYFVAQIIAAIAVVASLIFVGLQVRANTKEQAHTRLTEAADTYDRFQSLLVENPELRDLIVKGADDITKLTNSERLAFGAFMSMFVSSIMRFHMRARAGYSSPSNWEELKRMNRPLTSQKGAQQWWQRSRMGYSDWLRELVDEAFAEGAGPEEDH